MHALAALVLLSRLAAALAAAGGSDGQEEPEGSCLLCPWLDDLPLDEWSAERNASVVERLPWGEEYTLGPLDYRELGRSLCECVLQAQEGLDRPAPDFVQAAGPQLVLGGAPFYFAGFNVAQATAWAASNTTRFLDDLELLFASAEGWGLKVGRVWAHADGWPVLPPTNRQWDELPRLTMQIEPGLYNEAALEALDLVLDTAARHGIRLILTMADYHSTWGSGQNGIEPYLQWALGRFNLSGTTVLDFYADERAKLLFKANLCHMATRVNSLTGVAYKDDPTILAWDLINEPRCPACPGRTQSEVLARWAEEMAGFMKCIDPKHLVTVGTEGYFGESDGDKLLLANPGAWVLCEGASWTELGAVPGVDFTVAHMYPSMKGTWDALTKSSCGFTCAMRWYPSWLEAHIDASSAKPFVLEEFGQPYSQARRNQVFELVRNITRRKRVEDPRSPAAGTMFWGATVGAQWDWDGFQVFLDGSLPLPAPERQAALAKENMPAAEKEWLEAVKAMQAAFRRQEAESRCYEEMSRRYGYLYNAPLEAEESRVYNSTPTLLIVEKMVRDAEAAPAPAADGGVAQRQTAG